MINTITKDNKKEYNNLLSLESLVNEIYLLPNWEKIKDITLSKKRFLFGAGTSVNVSLFRKFSTKHNIEKYCIKDSESNLISNIDLRVYKDCVYIINLNVFEQDLFNESMDILLQTSVEKALYNTTEKKLSINLSFSPIINNKIKKIISNEDFIVEATQRDYEKSIFGETWVLDAVSSDFWMKKINKMSILLNK